MNYAAEASLLIHEATFESNMSQEAKKKKHTTNKEALYIVKKVKPWRTILTHFSSQNNIVPEILAEYNEYKIMLAFDHMRLNLSHFEWAYKYLSILQNQLTDEKDFLNV